MKPIEFSQQNMVFAKDQPEYLPLPAYRSPDGVVITCWMLSWRERVKAFLSGCVWVRQLTFNAAIQPQRLDIDSPFAEEV